LELQPNEVVRFFITTIEFSEKTKKAVLESKRKIFLLIVNYKEINNKNTLTQSNLNELIRIKEILQNSKEKVLINTKNKNIYLMIKENRIDKWEKNNWCSVNNKKIKASKKICIEIRNL
ncbi:16460_t:CDS:2, partial [Gigaspora margarita]